MSFQKKDIHKYVCIYIYALTVFRFILFDKKAQLLVGEARSINQRPRERF